MAATLRGEVQAAFVWFHRITIQVEGRSSLNLKHHDGWKEHQCAEVNGAETCGGP